MGEKTILDNRGGATRQSNIELLRILSIVGVFILHYVSPGAGGGLKYVAEGSLNYYILLTLESVFVCAVDLFMLISGYFLCTSNRRNLWKVVRLIMQVMLYSLAGYLATAVRTGSFSINGMIGSMVPANYFVILYSAVFIISPFINLIFEKITKRQMRFFVLLLFVLFGIYPTLVDTFSVVTGHSWDSLSTIGVLGNQWGYTVVTFALMYTIGAYLRLGDFEITHWRTSSIVYGILALVSASTLWAAVFLFWRQTSAPARHYCNPLVILLAVFLFVAFSRFKISSRISVGINGLAKGVFSMFLLHGWALPRIHIQRFVSGSPMAMIAHIFFSALTVFLICTGIDYIYHWFTNPFFRWLERKVSLPDINYEDYK